MTQPEFSPNRPVSHLAGRFARRNTHGATGLRWRRKALHRALLRARYERNWLCLTFPVFVFRACFGFRYSGSALPSLRLGKLALFGFVFTTRPSFLGQKRRNWVCLAHKGCDHRPVPLVSLECRNCPQTPPRAWSRDLHRFAQIEDRRQGQIPPLVASSSRPTTKDSRLVLSYTTPAETAVFRDY
jgi:hypothetical protein